MSPRNTAPPVSQPGEPWLWLGETTWTITRAMPNRSGSTFCFPIRLRGETGVTNTIAAPKRQELRRNDMSTTPTFFKRWLAALALTALATSGAGMLATTAHAAPPPPPAAQASPAVENLQWVLGTHVTFFNMTDTTIAVAQVKDGYRTAPESDPQFIAPGKAEFYSGDNTGSASADVRLRIYTAERDPVTGQWKKGEMRQIITASNRAIGTPYVTIMADPRMQGDEMRNDYGMRELSENQGRHADFLGQRTYVERRSDSPDHKIFEVKLYEAAPHATQDYPLTHGGGGNAG